MLWTDSDGRLVSIARRVPLPVRIALFTVWAAAAAFGKWENINEHDVPLAVDVVAGTGAVVFAAFGVEHFFRTWDRPHRPPFELSQGWLVFFTVTGSLLGLGILGLVDDDPKTIAGISAATSLVGVVFGRALRPLPAEAGGGSRTSGAFALPSARRRLRRSLVAASQ